MRPAVIGVCSWSLRASSPGELVERVRACGVSAVQLALEPMHQGRWSVDATREALAAAGIAIVSGMFEPVGEDYSSIAAIKRTGGVRQDSTWPETRRRAGQAADIASALALPLVTLHAGFIPHDAEHGERGVMIERLRELVDVFGARGVRVAFETGQESAQTLGESLEEIGEPRAMVNFDPANMLLYGTGDPVSALKRLLPWVAQVHLKDALPPARAGEWGTEVPVGRGRVDWPGFFEVLEGSGRRIAAMLEREAGERRVEDVREGGEFIGSLLGSSGRLRAREPLGVGIIGLGFMGRTHAGAYGRIGQSAAACRVVAIADRDASRVREAASGGNLNVGSGGALDLSAVRVHERTEALLAEPAVSLVSICTPTPTHVDLAIAALRAGKHVLIEKPVALSVSEVQRLRAVAAEHPGLVCVPAMCMRFWPGWDWLKRMVEDGVLGAVRSATFQRLGSTPAWGQGFYSDFAQSGGALMDLHVHDADFVAHAFGMPSEVHVGGSRSHPVATYLFEQGEASGPRAVLAEGAWDHAPSFGFRMRYVVNFERATAEFDLSRPVPLVVHRAEQDESNSVAGSVGDGYLPQARAAVNAAAGVAPATVTLEDAERVARLLEAERASLDGGGRVRV